MTPRRADLLLHPRFRRDQVDPTGGVAQLVERFHGMEEVVSSSLIASTFPQRTPEPARVWAFFFGLEKCD